MDTPTGEPRNEPKPPDVGGEGPQHPEQPDLGTGSGANPSVWRKFFRRLTEPAKSAISHVRQVYRDHPLHWPTAVTLIALSWYLGPYVEEHGIIQPLQYWLYGFTQNTSPRHPQARFTVVVKIDDEAYYLGEPQHRRPLKRLYIARLAEKLAKFSPGVIAFDVDFRAVDPSGKTRVKSSNGAYELPVSSDYLRETEEMLDRIRAVSAKCPIVLARRIVEDPDNDEYYIPRSDQYDGYDFGTGQVTRGHILFADDIRFISPIIHSKTEHFDSLALAAIRATKREVLAGKDWEVVRFGSFIPEEAMPSVKANEVLCAADDDAELKRRLNGQIVLVGGTWHRGDMDGLKLEDGWDTPIGVIPGVFVHANYAEAILDQRFYPTVFIGKVVEAIAGLALAFLLSFGKSGLAKLGIIIGSLGLIFLFSLLLLVFLGIFCDVVVSGFFLIVHVIVEPFIHSLFSSHAE
jgi:CHASE2 domain-containing sensor protein